MKIQSAFVAAMLVFGAPQALAQAPKTGGTLLFAVSAEPPNYDCHAQTRSRSSTRCGRTARRCSSSTPRTIPRSWAISRSPDGGTRRSTCTFKLKRSRFMTAPR
jgi:hypothetical protein